MSFPIGNYPLPLEAKPAALYCPCCLLYMVGFCSRTLFRTHKMPLSVKPLMSLSLTPGYSSVMKLGEYRACKPEGVQPNSIYDTGGKGGAQPRKE